MKTNTSITLFHYDEESETETSCILERAYIYGAIKIGDLSHGRRSENSYIVRIPTNSDITVSCGDKVYCEKLNKTFVVVGISDNRIGTRFSRHIKLYLK